MKKVIIPLVGLFLLCLAGELAEAAKPSSRSFPAVARVRSAPRSVLVPSGTIVYIQPLTLSTNDVGMASVMPYAIFDSVPPLGYNGGYGLVPTYSGIPGKSAVDMGSKAVDAAKTGVAVAAANEAVGLAKAGSSLDAGSKAVEVAKEGTAFAVNEKVGAVGSSKEVDAGVKYEALSRQMPLKYWGEFSYIFADSLLGQIRRNSLDAKKKGDTAKAVQFESQFWEEYQKVSARRDALSKKKKPR